MRESRRRMTGIMDLRARTPAGRQSVVGLALLVIAINLVVAWRIDADCAKRAGERGGLRAPDADGFCRPRRATARLRRQPIARRPRHLPALRRERGLPEFLATTKALHSESIIVATTFSDHDGHIVFDSEKSQVPNVIAADLDYFRYFQYSRRRCALHRLPPDSAGSGKNICFALFGV